MNLETLCKMYLELSQVVPATCRTERELKIQRKLDRAKRSLHYIADGQIADKDVRAYALQAAR